jgi:hypothetical protein
MGLVFLFIKIFPVFGISLGVIFLDISRSMKRRGSKGWLGLLGLSVVFFVLTAAWIFFRGDRNADLWFSRMIN